MDIQYAHMKTREIINVNRKEKGVYIMFEYMSNITEYDYIIMIISYQMSLIR